MAEPTQNKPILNKKVIKDLQVSFKHLKDPVTLAVFTKQGQNDEYNKIARQLITEFAAVDERLHAEFYDIGDEMADKHGIERSPTVMISPEKYNIRFTGTPLGEEGQSLVMSIILASTGQASVLSTESLKALGTLTARRDARVFVSPT